MTDCDAFTDRLDAWIDAELSPAEHEDVGRHVATCPSCRADLAALQALQMEARALPRSVTPERDLWTGIETRISARPAGGVGSSPAGMRAPWWTLLAAAIGLVLLGATLAELRQRAAGATGFVADRARYTAASAALAQALATDPGTLPPTARGVVERNLGIIDQAIREAEAALATDPGNVALERMVVAGYKQRLALLRHATSAGRRES